MKYPLYKGQEVCFQTWRNKILYGIVIDTYTRMDDTVIVIFEDCDQHLVVDINLLLPWKWRYDYMKEAV